MNRTVVKFGPETETKEQLLVPEDLVKTERESPDQTAQVWKDPWQVSLSGKNNSLM